jgi:hypothetical protein
MTVRAAKSARQSQRDKVSAAKSAREREGKSGDIALVKEVRAYMKANKVTQVSTRTSITRSRTAIFLE